MAKVQQHEPVPVRMPPWGVYVLQSVHAPDFRFGTMRHDYLKLVYALRGAGVLARRGRREAFRAGDLLVVPIGQSHRIEDEPGDPLSLVVVCVEAKVWSVEPAVAARLPTGRVARGAVSAAGVRSMIRRLLYEQTAARPGAALMMTGLAQQLVASLAQSMQRRRAPAEPDRRLAVQRYARRLRQRFFDATTLDDAARELGMSRRRFTQLFREVTGESWAQHVRRLRVAHARQLLRRTDRTVLAIAFECGFDDLSAFYRAFRAIEGTSPDRWRGARRG